MITLRKLFFVSVVCVLFLAACSGAPATPTLQKPAPAAQPMQATVAPVAATARPTQNVPAGTDELEKMLRDSSNTPDFVEKLRDLVKNGAQVKALGAQIGSHHKMTAVFMRAKDGSFGFWSGVHSDFYPAVGIRYAVARRSTVAEIDTEELVREFAGLNNVEPEDVVRMYTTPDRNDPIDPKFGVKVEYSYSSPAESRDDMTLTAFNIEPEFMPLNPGERVEFTDEVRLYTVAFEELPTVKFQFLVTQDFTLPSGLGNLITGSNMAPDNFRLFYFTGNAAAGTQTKVSGVSQEDLMALTMNAMGRAEYWTTGHPEDKIFRFTNAFGDRGFADWKPMNAWSATISTPTP